MLLTLLTALAPYARAEEASEPIVTDRPDIAESSLAVGKGVYQLEQGVALDGAALAVGFPSLSRFGIGGGVELRVETPLVSVGGGTVAFDGVAVGGKWHPPVEGPSLGILASAAFDATGAFSPILKVAYDVDLPAGFELGVNVGGTTTPGLTDPIGLWAVAVGRPVSERLRFYVEGSGEVGAADVGTSVAVDGGVSYLITDDIQWDASGLVGVLGGGWGAGTGISLRFD